MANKNLAKAKTAKNDEFYTQYSDIQIEMNAYLEYNPDVFRDRTILLPCDDPEWSNFTKFFAQNFENFGLKKLISTSYAAESKKIKSWQPTLFETENPNYDADKSRTNGKIFVLDHDTNQNGRIDINDLQWDYLEGDGDFRSEEVRKLRNEADIVVTNPPFSLFTDFLMWIIENKKKFLILGNMNAIAYKEIFPMIMENKIWLGTVSGAKEYLRPDGGIQKMGNTYWFTNLEHGRRHQFLSLMTMEDNIKFSKHKELKGKRYYQYENFNAIEIPFTDSIPSDYTGIMGVPISFLDKYCPEQFEIMGIANGGDLGVSYGVSSNLSKEDCIRLFKEDKGFRRGKLCYRDENNKLISCFAKILIRKKQ
ncbi:MAG: DNA methyltransferase [Bacteroidales bacterium]|nr:DNA methyltransferase [Bacteroidales bacterium]